MKDVGGLSLVGVALVRDRTQSWEWREGNQTQTLFGTLNFLCPVVFVLLLANTFDKLVAIFQRGKQVNIFQR
jgi:hypothetical protein